MRAGGTGTTIGALARRWWPLAAVTALLAVAAVAAGHSALRFNRTGTPSVERLPLEEYEVPSGQPTFPRTAEEIAPAEPGLIPDWLTTAALAICLLVTLAVVAVPVWQVIRSLLRRRGRRLPAGPAAPSSEQTAQEVVAALDAGLVDLSDTDADPRRAVIACWVRLEQAAAAAGLPREVGDTPTDLVGRLLSARAGVSADVLAAFAHVYREARYATHAVDESMRAQARAALQRLRGELTAGAVPR
nr:DUF4129 domain-containing protein [Micromonospora sp. DSM 115978]